MSPTPKNTKTRTIKADDAGLRIEHPSSPERDELDRVREIARAVRDEAAVGTLETAWVYRRMIDILEGDR